ncbi:MAG: hypothetical protein A2Y17_11815 [Clostridiales bacterium GWF2_38_85]|nr:MAG: hypothetical protein A2Y17_11815 [Clostridiales bacterium GWF2_38_85]HBL85388.1 GDSL family lipase [Clostridiales bacterium]
MLFDYIENDTTIMFSGDSVTDCGRGRPYGNCQTGLGSGYPFFIHNILTGTYPEKHIKIVNTGISGETSSDVRTHWESDMTAIKPDYAAIMIGVNDVWRKYDSYMFPERQVSVKQYEENLRYIVADAKRKTKGFMIISPFFLDLNKNDAMRKDVDELNVILRKIAYETDSLFCDVQAALDLLLTKLNTTAYSLDRVHPFPHTHYAIARCILSTIGFKF